MIKYERDKISPSERIAKNDKDKNNEAGRLIKKTFMFPTTTTTVKVRASHIPMNCLIMEKQH